MKVKSVKVGQLKANCYLLLNENSSEALIIDPGDDADYIQRILSDNDSKPSAILATHGHFDHLLAATEMKLAYNIPFLMSPKDEFLLKRMESSARYYTGVSAVPPPDIDVSLKSGNMTIGPWSFEVINTPGHTPGGVSFFFPQEKAVFVGDLVFSRGHVGRTDFQYSSREQLEKSIVKITELPMDTTVYPGHGELTSIEQIKEMFRV